MSTKELFKSDMFGSYIDVEDLGHEKIGYLGGPMRGIPRWNFDEFYRIEGILIKNDWKVFNPARHDEEDTGLNADDYPVLPDGFVEHAMRWDLARISEDSECVIFLPGWRNSSGANQERQVAIWTHRPVYEVVAIDSLDRFVDLRVVTDENI